MLTAFLWAVGVALPRAARRRDGCALICSSLSAAIALAAFLLIGIGVR